MEVTPRWIWLSNPQYEKDVYGDFYDSFPWDESAPVSMHISADSNYAVYLNGAFVSSGQYPDFPHYKVYDVLDLTPFCRGEINHLAVVVWHYGEANMSYFPGMPGLYYHVYAGRASLAASSAGTLSRLSCAYRSGVCKKITGQLGFSFHYDAAQPADWMLGLTDGFSESVCVDLPSPAHERPVERCLIGRPLDYDIIRQDDRSMLVDLRAEQTGYLMLTVTSSVRQQLTICYGEHIADGDIRRVIGARDFSVTVTVPSGTVTYMNPFRRLGARYISLTAACAISDAALTLCPVTYPVRHTAPPPDLSPLQQRIYDASVYTLLLCMHDHYEDSPWREQALYAMDSRNQMLCGYFAFQEFRFARASLLLMAQDRRPDGLLSICTPSGNDLTIPSFSLHYFIEVLEYTRYTGDLTLAHDVFPKLKSVINAFIRHMDGPLLPVFTEACHWNFYEWSYGLSGRLYAAEPNRIDAALNCLFSLALRAISQLAHLTGHEDCYTDLRLKLNRAIHERFWDEKQGSYLNSTSDCGASELVNALAILCGAADGRTATMLAEKLSRGSHGMTPVTLSMRCFLYDALLKTDAARYSPNIISDIDARYARMLDAGATTFWETERGEQDFDLAGSLCHGWSAMPVYYYHLLHGAQTPTPYYA